MTIIVVHRPFCYNKKCQTYQTREGGSGSFGFEYRIGGHIDIGSRTEIGINPLCKRLIYGEP